MNNKIVNLVLVSILYWPSSYATDQVGNIVVDVCIARESTLAANEQTIGEIRKLCQDKEHTLIGERRALEKSVASNPFAIVPYKPNYILPFTYSKINREPYEELLDGRELSDTEIKIQVSIKYIAIENLFVNDLEFALTVTRRWQAYNTDISTPFRETIYEPELMLLTNNLGLFGAYQ
ncbi:phospholipase A [Colwellia sp.]|uniref:phospholipase A n=1 Tax=Colwellia sp. TaxID=56799 RepID=UPI0025B9BF23|nr:phospholipase A [Colwellia sp.]